MTTAIPQPYEVKYRSPGRLFFTKLKDIINDGFIEGHNCRFFVRMDGRMVFISCDSEVIFGKSRVGVIKQQVQEEAGR